MICMSTTVGRHLQMRFQVPMSVVHLTDGLRWIYVSCIFVGDSRSGIKRPVQTVMLLDSGNLELLIRTIVPALLLSLTTLQSQHTTWIEATLLLCR